MTKDQQVRRLINLMRRNKTLTQAAAESGMDENTARKYLQLRALPSEVKAEHTWKTRSDPFEKVWNEVKEKLELNAGLEAKTLFDDLKRRYSGEYSDGQLRTLQRRIKVWRATEGPPKEVYFPQRYIPGELCESDFTHMDNLGVTIAGELFYHMIHHFVLPYSNWETGTICFSESFESLSVGLQNGVWELGGVPKAHRTDRLTTAVQRIDHQREFTDRYEGLLKHYRMEGRKIQAGKPHENGDVEQLHYRFKKAVDQQLMLRGSRDFASRQEYEKFLRTLFSQLNAGRQNRLKEELKVLRRLPSRRLEACTRIPSVKVISGSTITVDCNIYSVDSRLIGEKVSVRRYADYLEVWYGQRCVEQLPRLRGRKKHHIQYRHIVDWLVRKPGAFENYRYREDLFPTTRFRMAYDQLRREHSGMKGVKEYLSILQTAAKVSEELVDEALECLFEAQTWITASDVKMIVENWREHQRERMELKIDEVQLKEYDRLLESEEALR